MFFRRHSCEGRSSDLDGCLGVNGLRGSELGTSTKTWSLQPQRRDVGCKPRPPLRIMPHAAGFLVPCRGDNTETPLSSPSRALFLLAPHRIPLRKKRTRHSTDMFHVARPSIHMHPRPSIHTHLRLAQRDESSRVDRGHAII